MPTAQTPSTRRSFDEIFSDVELRIIRSTANRYDGTRKLEREDIEQEAAMALLEARANPRAKVKQDSEDYGRYARKVVQNAIGMQLRETSRQTSKIAYDDLLSIDSWGGPRSTVGPLSASREREQDDGEVDIHSVNDHTEANVALGEILDGLVRQLSQYPEGDRYVALLQDVLSWEDLAEPTRRVTLARKRELEEKAGKNVKSQTPLKTILRAHNLSYAQGVRFFKIVAAFLRDNGLADSINWIERHDDDHQEKGESACVPRGAVLQSRAALRHRPLPRDVDGGGE